MQLIIEKVDPLSPHSYCFVCKRLLKPGEGYMLKQLDCRHPVYKKNNRRLKGNTHIGLKVHSPRCT